MIEAIRNIFDLLQTEHLSIAEAEQSIIDLFEDNKPNTECICCYMTTGEHSNICPKYNKYD